MAKMDPSATDMALAVWNGHVQDATVEDMHVSDALSSKFSRIARMWVS